MAAGRIESKRTFLLYLDSHRPVVMPFYITKPNYETPRILSLLLVFCYCCRHNCYEFID